MAKTDRLKIATGIIWEEFGGVSRYIRAIQKFSSHQVYPLPPDYVKTTIGKLAPKYYNLASWYYYMFVCRFGLHGYNILHSHPDPGFINLCQRSRTHTCKWVHTYHTLEFEEDYPNGLQPQQKEINKVLLEIASKADIKISVSKWLQEYLLAHYSIQTEYIPNGVDQEACDKANPERFVKKCGFDNFVLFVGSSIQIKNPQIFVKLASSIPKTKFVMIGRNLDNANFFKEYRLAIPNNLVLLGEMNHSDVLDAMSTSRSFVMTSQREGLPTVLMEAMALGKPVVVPNHSGCKEIVENETNGFLYNPTSFDDLVDKTKQSLISTRVGEQARKRVLKNYDWKVVAKRIDSLYEGIVKVFD